MVKKMIITTLVSASALVLPLTSFAASSVIGVKTFNADSSAVFNFFDNTGADQGSANVAITDATSQVAYADLTTNPGLETISYYDQYNYNTVLNSVVMIADQAGNTLDTFYPYPDQTDQHYALLAVGDLSSDHAGPEIVLCDRTANDARIKILSYVEGEVVTKLSSFYPFGENNTTPKSCEYLLIGDVDGDGNNDIVVNLLPRSGKTKKIIKFFSADGILKSTINLSDSEQWASGTLPQLTLWRNAETNQANIVFSSELASALHGNYFRTINIMDYTGELVSTINWGSISGKEAIKDWIVGDIDHDGEEELIVLQKGRRGKVRILNGAGEVENEFKAYPNATEKQKHVIYFGDFAY